MKLSQCMPNHHGFIHFLYHIYINFFKSITILLVALYYIRDKVTTVSHHSVSPHRRGIFSSPYPYNLTLQLIPPNQVFYITPS